MSKNILGLELIRQDQIGMADQAPVHRDDVLCHVEVTIITHDGVEDPEEATRLSYCSGPVFELLGYFPHCLEGSCSRNVA